MSISFKALAALLSYPSEDLVAALPEIRAILEADRALPRSVRADLGRLVDDLAGADLLDAQERYVALFDRGRATSLHLFEHVHGESRDRGQAMVDLLEAYRRNGFELAAKELPDYLPLLLEYLSHRPQHESVDWLQHIGHIVALLAARATERQSRYAVLFDILVDIGAGRLDVRALRERASTEPRDDTPEAMDRLWEEEAVRFGVEAPDRDCAPTSRQVPR